MATPSSILAWRFPMDRGACWATVHGVARSWTRLSDWACAHARLRVSVPWIWRWLRPVTGSLQIGLEGWVSGNQIREPVLSISLHSALAGTTPRCWWWGAERTLCNPPPPPPAIHCCCLLDMLTWALPSSQDQELHKIALPGYSTIRPTPSCKRTTVFWSTAARHNSGRFQ